MELSQRARAIWNVTPYAIIAMIVVVFVWFAASHGTREVGVITGTIEGVTFRTPSGEKGSEQRSAVIRLSDGTIAQGRIATPGDVRAGQRVKIKVYEELFSSTRTYEVVGTLD